MKNETFREIGFWGSLGAAVLGLINYIICLVKGIQVINTELNGDPFEVLAYAADASFYTVLYKVSLGILGLAALMMIISFFINTSGALKIIMIVVKTAQIACIAAALIGVFIMHSLALLKLFSLIFAALELISLILYIIDRDHRKTIIRFILFAIFTVGSGSILMIILMLFVFLLLARIVLLIVAIFNGPERKIAITDIDGKIIGWLKRD